MIVSIEEAIKRLKASKRSYEQGRKQGHFWAEDLADYPTLLRCLEDIGDRTCTAPPSWNSFNMPEEEEIRFRELQEFAEADGNPLRRDPFVAGWIEGVLVLWSEVSEHLNQGHVELHRTSPANRSAYTERYPKERDHLTAGGRQRGTE